MDTKKRNELIKNIIFYERTLWNNGQMIRKMAINIIAINGNPEFLDIENLQALTDEQLKNISEGFSEIVAKGGL